VPIPFDSVIGLEQHDNDVYLYSAKGGGMFENGTLSYTILQDKQTYLEPGEVSDKDKVKG
jgi:hypothetical protein